MASYQTERTFAGKTSQEIFEQARKTIDELAGRYALKHEPNPQQLSGKVARLGADGRYRVSGDRLSLELDFGFLVPGALRQKVQKEVDQRLDSLFG